MGLSNSREAFCASPVNCCVAKIAKTSGFVLGSGETGNGG